MRNEVWEEPNLKSRLFNSLVIAAFSGLLVCSLMGFLGLENRDIQSVFSGVAGYAGPAFLDDIVSRLRSMFLSKLKKDGAMSSEEADIVKGISRKE